MKSYKYLALLLAGIVHLAGGEINRLKVPVKDEGGNYIPDDKRAKGESSADHALPDAGTAVQGGGDQESAPSNDSDDYSGWEEEDVEIARTYPGVLQESTYPSDIKNEVKA